MKLTIENYLLLHHAEQAAKISADQRAIFQTCVAEITDRSESQHKTMLSKILPRIALYKALIQNGFSLPEAKQTVKDSLHFTLTPQAKNFQRLDRLLPFFFPLFQKICLSVMKSDNWKTVNIERGGRQFSFDIVDCLWYNTCVQYGCPELCSVFCDNDHLLYGDLPHTAFLRSETIAAGDNRCDFCFKRK